jgi:hypothetical protein
MKTSCHASLSIGYTTFAWWSRDEAKTILVIRPAIWMNYKKLIIAIRCFDSNPCNLVVNKHWRQNSITLPRITDLKYVEEHFIDWYWMQFRQPMLYTLLTTAGSAFCEAVSLQAGFWACTHHEGEQLELKLQSDKSKAWPTRFENGERSNARNIIEKNWSKI